MAKTINHQYQLQATLRDIRRAYAKDDPFLRMAIINARKVYLHSKRAVKEFNYKRLDHWVGHALATSKPAKIKGYCKHKVR